LRNPELINTAIELYRQMGFASYAAIDGKGGAKNVHQFDLNINRELVANISRALLIL
jgi:hypothetical protein